MQKDLQELLICKFYLKHFIKKKVRNVTLQRPGRIDPHIGIMVKTPKTHYKCPFQAPKIIDFNSRTLILSMEIVFCLCVFGLPHMQEEDFLPNCTYALVIRVFQYYCPIIVQTSVNFRVRLADSLIKCPRTALFLSSFPSHVEHPTKFCAQ